MNKRAIAILGAIFLLIVGTAAFLIFQKKPAPTASNTQTNIQTPAPTGTQPATNTTPPTSTTPPDTGGNTGSTFNNSTGAIKLTDDNVISPVLFFQGNGVTYFNSQGQLFQSDLQTATSGLSLANKRELTIPLKPGITNILWPATGNNFIAEFSTGGQKTWSTYISDRGTYVDLPKQITSISWLPSGDKIIYTWLSGDGKTSMNTSDADATNYKVSAQLFNNDIQLTASPDGKSVLFYRTSNPGATNPIVLTVPDGKLFKNAVAEGFNIGAVWAPDSRKFLFNRKDPSTGNLQLWVGDIITGQSSSLGVNTDVSKAVWTADSQVVIAAVPKASGSSGDMISKINVSSGAKVDVDPGTSVGATDLFLSTAGDKVFFKNSQDGGLYYLNLSN